jgi:hypothetical protein
MDPNTSTRVEDAFAVPNAAPSEQPQAIEQAQATPEMLSVRGAGEIVMSVLSDSSHMLDVAESNRQAIENRTRASVGKYGLAA